MKFHERSRRQVNRGFVATRNRQRPVARGICELLEIRRLFAILTVNTISDADARDSFLSIREAIELADGTLSFGVLSAAEQAQVNLVSPLGAGDDIEFNIPGGGVQTIFPTVNLPTITSTVVIDGYSQPGAARATDTSPAVDLIRLNGASDTDEFGLGLESEATETHIVGLVIDNFSAEGIVLQSGSTNNVLEGDYIGVTPDGLFAEGNGTGVALAGSKGSLIGSVGPSDRNIISGNTVGIEFIGSDDGADVTGNYIGVDATGTGELGNDNDGIDFLDAQNVTVGGTTSDERNIISNNGGDGIKFDASKAVGNNVKPAAFPTRLAS